MLFNIYMVVFVMFTSDSSAYGLLRYNKISSVIKRYHVTLKKSIFQETQTFKQLNNNNQLIYKESKKLTGEVFNYDKSLFYFHLSVSVTMEVQGIFVANLIIDS